MGQGGYSRRRLLGGLAGFGGVAGACAASEALGVTSFTGLLRAGGDETVRPARTAPGRGTNRVVTENRAPGVDGFTLERLRFGNDIRRQVEGYASETSVEPGGSLDLHGSVGAARRFRIRVYRVGDYAGTGARLMTQSPWLAGTRQPLPIPRAGSGLLSCDWPVSWTLRVGRDWVSGYYLALFVSEDGYHRWYPFVVREPNRASDLLVVVGTATYQAYNQWPLDRTTGRSLYYGYTASGTKDYQERSRVVSHDRPYRGNGLPNLVQRDIGLVRWLESAGYDLTYATSEDLHAGRVHSARHRAIVFASHDEYWSPDMRQRVTSARDAGVSLAFMTANNVYWKIEYQPASDGRPDRVVHCEKVRPGAAPATGRDLVKWRETDPEQRLLGVQYSTVLPGSVPLVVRGADHWFWAGTGARNGDRIRDVVSEEVDAQLAGVPLPRHRERVLLAASPFTSTYGRPATQHTQLYQAESGAWVFVAGTLGWSRSLYDPEYHDPRIEHATQNLLARMTGGG